MVGTGRNAGAGGSSLITAMAIEDDILDCLKAIEPGKSLGPQDIAKQIGADEWRNALSSVKKAALGMARAGQIEILRKGKSANPNAPIKGVIRYRLSAE
jgi:Protein of unknown function (DUF3253)